MALRPASVTLDLGFLQRVAAPKFLYCGSCNYGVTCNYGVSNGLETSKIIYGARKITLFRRATQFANTFASAVGIAAIILLCALKYGGKGGWPPKLTKKADIAECLLFCELCNYGVSNGLETSKTRSVRKRRRARTQKYVTEERANATQYCAVYKPLSGA